MNKLQIKTKETCEIIPKIWGEEIIIHSDNSYCCKILSYKGKTKSSNHFHCDKEEALCIISGVFKLTYIDPETGEEHYSVLYPGTFIDIPFGNCHELECISETGGQIFEASSFDDPDDTFRLNKSRG